jgi:hypothetical protein
MDPRNPNVLYAAAYQRRRAVGQLIGGGPESGLYKTTDGGQVWKPSTAGLQFVDPAFEAHKVSIHPLTRNVVFAGGTMRHLVTFDREFGAVWGVSTDSAVSWTRLDDVEGKDFLTTTLAPDPSVLGGWLAVPNVWADPPTLRWPTGGRDHPFGSDGIFKMQIVGDAPLTVVASLFTGTRTFPTGRTVIFSFAELRNNLPLTVEDTGLTGPPGNVVFDASSGANRVFVGGSAIIGGDPDVLYWADVNLFWYGIGAQAWQPVPIGDGVFQNHQRFTYPVGNSRRQTSFSTLLIDPAGGGQTMYTLGSNNTLWESRDGGRSWRRDEAAPGYVTGAWLSPVLGPCTRRSRRSSRTRRTTSTPVSGPTACPVRPAWSGSAPPRPAWCRGAAWCRAICA